MLVGKKVAHQPIYPYNIIENFPASLVHYSVFIGPDHFKFGTEIRCVVLIGHIQIWDKLIINCIMFFDDKS